ncbi:MAG: hypothetical protein ACI8PZ_006183 [Myxococcota bacterium]|jgi:hypothetical protein
MTGLPAPPDLRIRVDHDGFICDAATGDPRPLHVLAWVAAAFGVGLAAISPLPGVIGLAIAGVGGSAALFAGRPRTLSIEVSGRNLIVSEWGHRGRSRRVLPLPSLTVVRLARRSDDYSRPYLLIEHGEERIRFGEGLREPTLEWLVTALDAARDHHERQQSADGREWSFHRKPPDALEALRGDDNGT